MVLANFLSLHVKKSLYMKYLFLLLFLISFKISSQELLFEKEIKLRSTFFTQIDNKSFPILNKTNNETGLFLIDRKEIKSYLFNENYILINTFSTNTPKAKYRILLGNTYKDNNYHLIFTNEKKNRFLKKTINILDKKSRYSELDIKFKKETYLESISYNDKFYIITIKRGKSILYIYEIDGDKYGKVGTIDLSEHQFTKNSKSLNYILTHTTSALRDNVLLKKIDNKNPNSVDITSFANKMYCYDNTIFITLDVFNDLTKIISIDLNSFDYEVKDYHLPNINCELGLRSNSYLLKDNIYQVSGCKNELYFSVSSLNDGTKLKEWHINKNEAISFKNTPFIQLGGAFKKNEKYKELKDTEHFLRKIDDGNIGISAYELNNNIEITIGGYKKMQTKQIISALAISGGIVAGGLLNVNNSNDMNCFYNPTNYCFNNYFYCTNMYNNNSMSYNSSHNFNNAHARSIFFKSLFNENIENIKGEMNENAFDKIWMYVAERNKLSTMTVFKVEKDYILGYYNTKEKKYYLYKFLD